MIYDLLRAGLRRVVPYACLPLTASDQAFRPGIRILMYHRVAHGSRYDQLTVSPERFAEQLEELAARWRVISLSRAISELERGSPRTVGVAVTFDDGYRDNLVNALPLLRKYEIPATIFVASRFCAQTHRHPRYSEEPGRLHLDWDEVHLLARTPGISIGSHSLTHPYLTRLGAAEAAREILESRREIADRTGTNVDFFCYPSGDLTGRERSLVADAGYRAAVSVRPGSNRAREERFALRRTEVTDHDGARALTLKLMGAFDPMHRLLEIRRGRDFASARRAAHSATTGSSD